MRIARDGRFIRTDIWREGKWLDLWSVVHLLSGITIGLGFSFLHFDPFASVALTLVSLVAYEMWEQIVQIEEAPTNRFMDVVVGMASFLPTLLLLAPLFSRDALVASFAFVLTITIVLSIFGWHASQKAAALKKRVRARLIRERAKFREEKARLRERFRR